MRVHQMLNRFDDVCLSICLSAQLYSGCAKRFLVRKNEGIACKLAKEFKNERNFSKNPSTMPTGLWKKNSEHPCIPGFLLVTHKVVLHIPHINFHLKSENWQKQCSFFSFFFLG